jgi:hypothetical protein
MAVVKDCAALDSGWSTWRVFEDMARAVDVTSAQRGTAVHVTGVVCNDVEDNMPRTRCSAPLDDCRLKKKPMLSRGLSYDTY